MTLVHKRPWPGNTSAEVHGAASPRRVDPLMQQVIDEILADPATPAYVGEPSFRLSLEALARVTAVTQLLWAYVASQVEAQDLQLLFEDVTSAEETERRDGNVVTRRSVSKRVESALNQLRKYEVTAMQLRQKMGLDPSSRSKIARRILKPQTDLAALAAVIARQEKDGGQEDGESAAAVTDGSGSAVRPRAGKSV